MTVMDSPVALVTGAGQGIGRGIALQLAADGYLVVINDVVADPAKTDSGAYEVKATIESGGGRAHVIRADIADAAGRAGMIEEIAERFGRLDLLVNNAGVAPRERKDILEAGEESYDRVMGINLRAPYFLTQLAARRMIEWKRAGVVACPRIVFITSVSAYTSSPSRGEYCISKAGLSMVVKLYADRLAEFAIPVIEVRPGIIETPMTSVVKAEVRQDDCRRPAADEALGPPQGHRKGGERRSPRRPGLLDRPGDRGGRGIRSAEALTT